VRRHLRPATGPPGRLRRLSRFSGIAGGATADLPPATASPGRCPAPCTIRHHTAFAPTAVDLKLPITIIDELSEDEVRSEGELDLASGEIRNVRYVDHKRAAQGFPAAQKD